MRSLPGPGGSSQSCSNVPWLCIVWRKRPRRRAAPGTARLLISAPPGPYGGTSRPACVSPRTCACQKAAGSASTALLQALRRCEDRQQVYEGDIMAGRQAAHACTSA